MYSLYPSATKQLLNKYEDEEQVFNALKGMKGDGSLLVIHGKDTEAEVYPQGYAACMVCFSKFGLNTRDPHITQQFKQHAGYKQHINNLYVRCYCLGCKSYMIANAKIITFLSFT